MRDYSVYLNDILENIDKALSFIAGMSLDEFRNDVKTNYAVIRCLEIIGEASKNIPAALRNKYSEIPWKTIIGTRNVIVHEYADVDLNEVWKTTVNDLPKLKPQIQKMLRELK